MDILYEDSDLAKAFFPPTAFDHSLTYPSMKFCWGPITEPGRQILIQAMASAAVSLKCFIK